MHKNVEINLNRFVRKKKKKLQNKHTKSNYLWRELSNKIWCYWHSVILEWGIHGSKQQTDLNNRRFATTVNYNNVDKILNRNSRKRNRTEISMRQCGINVRLLFFKLKQRKMQVLSVKDSNRLYKIKLRRSVQRFDEICQTGISKEYLKLSKQEKIQ
jgi:hypothetical protein